MVTSLPNELQHAICHLILTDPGYNTKIMFELIRVNKVWAYFVCNRMYRHYRIEKYMTFIGFYNTIVSKRLVLPYGHFIESLDLTPINKYGVDMRAHELISRCPNLISVTLGHPTSLKPTTIRWMARHCKRLRMLSIGALESFPFMLECDFSSLVGLTTMTFTTTPLLCSSFLTLPRTLEELHLVLMDTLDTKTMIAFFHYRQQQQQQQDGEMTVHNGITRLEIHRCPRITNDMATWLPMDQLKWLSLSGPDLRDEHLIPVLSMTGTLDTLILENTQITTKVLDFLHTRTTSGGDGDGDGNTGRRCRVQINELYLNKNTNLSVDMQGLIKQAN
ncbi:unnamed protein product [Absidia cylindrospora]